MLTEHEASAIKSQIITKINENFPEEKRRFAIQRVESMNAEELEDFLVKNNLASSQGKDSEEQIKGREKNQCIFCLIVSGSIDSNKIAENESAIAVLEINPVSRGHVLIIPKAHAISRDKQSEKNINSLIKKVSANLKKKLKAKKVTTAKSNLFGHETINIIPQFSGEAETRERHKATPEELLELKAVLEEKKKSPTAEKKSKKPIAIKPEEKLWLPRRIP